MSTSFLLIVINDHQLIVNKSQRGTYAYKFFTFEGLEMPETEWLLAAFI
jgi:hypothetical protein